MMADSDVQQYFRDASANPFRVSVLVLRRMLQPGPDQRHWSIIQLIKQVRLIPPSEPEPRDITPLQVTGASGAIKLVNNRLCGAD